MFSIISKPSGTTVSIHTALEDAQVALQVIETTPPSHEIQELGDGTE